MKENLRVSSFSYSRIYDDYSIEDCEESTEEIKALLSTYKISGSGGLWALYSDNELVDFFTTEDDAWRAIALARVKSNEAVQPIVARFDEVKILVGILADMVGPEKYGEAVKKAGIKVTYTPLK